MRSVAALRHPSTNRMGSVDRGFSQSGHSLPRRAALGRDPASGHGLVHQFDIPTRKSRFLGVQGLGENRSWHEQVYLSCLHEFSFAHYLFILVTTADLKSTESKDPGSNGMTALGFIEGHCHGV